MSEQSWELKAARDFLQNRKATDSGRRGRLPLSYDLRMAWLCFLSNSYCQKWLLPIRKILHLCRCGELGGEFRMPTQYHDPARNYVFCCSTCAQDAQDYYMDLWSNLDGGCPALTKLSSDVSLNQLPRVRRTCLAVYVRFARFVYGSVRLVVFPIGAALSWSMFLFHAIKLRYMTKPALARKDV